MVSLAEPETNWLRTDEPSDVVASIRHVLRLLDFVEGDRLVWKWVIIAAHSALQGAMVCHLSGTAQLGCLSSKRATAWLAWWRDETKSASKADREPKNYMAQPDDLFERLYTSRKRIEQGCGGILEISVSQKASFKTLNAFRNKFIHFTPTIWSIELSGLPQIIGDIFSVIAQIASDDWPFRHLETQNRDELSVLLARIKDRLVALEEKGQSEVQS
jgi:hypothetical protein